MVALAFAALVAGCGEMRPVGGSAFFLIHKVEPGDTLYSIAWRFGYDHRELAAWNDIGPPYTIYPGQELVVMAPNRYEPPEPAEDAPAAARAVPGRATLASPVAPAPAVAAKVPAVARPTVPPAPRPEPPPRREVTSINWQWPTRGKLVAGFQAGAGRKGVDLAGREGQAVVAAAGGDVVYSGNGLIGYGNLVIIKHDDVYLSAYAHNRRLLVKEGEKVRAGQTIAEMGQTPKSGSILHFEIRKNGKPVDPLRYLPRQNS